MIGEDPADAEDGEHMAEIVLGLGTSHSPQLSTPPEKWLEDGKRLEQAGLVLHAVPNGEPVSFDNLAARAPPSIEDELTTEKFCARYEECRANLKWLGEVIEEHRPDVLIMFGDDQKELFLDEQIPAFGVYWGDTIPVIRGEARLSSMDAYSWEDDRQFPGAPKLAEQIIQHLSKDEFDVVQSSRVAAGRSISHPFAFVQRSILGERQIPTIPVWINTYFPPNQPTARRCIEFGRAIRRAVEASPGNERVAVLASGGLSHFVIDEELDRMMLKAMKERDFDALAAIPRARLRGGTSESTLWFAAAGAAEHLSMNDIRYVPGYRTRAATGCGMAFARWC